MRPEYHAEDLNALKDKNKPDAHRFR